MTLLELFSIDELSKNINNEFCLKEYEKGIYVGVDPENNVCVVTESIYDRQPVKMKTKAICLECNIKVDIKDSSQLKNCKVNIIKCLLSGNEDKDTFLELALLLIRTCQKTESDFIDAFRKLSKFFAESETLSETEMIGLYAELFTICKYEETLKISHNWQSRDRMKFDFSFSDTCKLEIKSTTKSIRTHHFKHEQLVSNVYNIFVLSYMLRRDDDGVSLFDLLLKAKSIVKDQPEKLYRISKILRDNNTELLKSLKFDRLFTENNMHFYKAEDLPKFNGLAPAGVSNAEYDCVLDNIPFLSEKEFINAVAKGNS